MEMNGWLLPVLNLLDGVLPSVKTESLVKKQHAEGPSFQGKPKTVINHPIDRLLQSFSVP